MDRTLKVYAKTGHLFAEITFIYEHAGQAKARCIQYRRLYDDDEEDDNKSVYPMYEREPFYVQFKKFDSIDKIKAHDIEYVKNELGRDMTDPRGYDYVYQEDPITVRYVAANHIGTIGMVNVTFSFINNTKEVKYLSATSMRDDYDFSSDSLETNIECITRIPLYDKWGDRPISTHDLKRLEPWP